MHLESEGQSPADKRSVMLFPLTGNRIDVGCVLDLMTRDSRTVIREQYRNASGCEDLVQRRVPVEQVLQLAGMRPLIIDLVHDRGELILQVISLVELR